MYVQGLKSVKMAVSRHDLQFQSLKLLKDCVLGTGAYGIIYKAKCDELVCAGKVLHRELFGFSDPSANTASENFERECQFLKAANHPNVVQYLASVRDHESGLPVLLMELMDESLTQFLQRHQILPYHVQVNLCQDIALALAYLHSNLGIVHRDLSSNNVLLIAERRAKITDFGTSKILRRNPGLTQHTICPGTQYYMAPEVLEGPSSCTDKMDCFSFGVLTIQTVTCQFPEPGPNRRKEYSQRHSLGEIWVPVEERERRKAHIDLIDPSHPLLPVALSCLEYKPENRPSASQLCSQLAVLKAAPQYTKSAHCTLEQGGSTTFYVVQGTGGYGEILDRKVIGSTTQSPSIATTAHAWEGGITSREKEEAKRKAERKLRSMKDTLGARNPEMETPRTETAKCVAAMKVEIQELTQALEQTKAVIQEKEKLVELRNTQLQEANQRLRDSEEMVAQFLDERCTVTYAHEQTTPTSSSTTHADQAPVAAAVSTSSTLSFTGECPRPPRVMTRGYTAVSGGTVYFTPHRSKDIYAYVSQERMWSQLPSCPYQGFSIAVVNGLLTAIGGAEMCMAGRVTNALVSLVEDGWVATWKERLPRMPTGRQLTSAVCSGNHLVVIGGVATGRLNVVEVMDTESKLWVTVRSLPHPLSESSATIVGDDIYLLGGLDGSGITSTVLSCSLTTLVRTEQSQTFVEWISRQGPVWQNTPNLSFYSSTAVTIGSQLLSVGGCDWDGSPTNSVQLYDPSVKSWRVIGRLSTARRLCLAAVLPGGRLMVVGGKASYGPTADVDMATLD